MCVLMQSRQRSAAAQVPSGTQCAGRIYWDQQNEEQNGQVPEAVVHQVRFHHRKRKQEKISQLVHPDCGTMCRNEGAWALFIIPPNISVIFLPEILASRESINLCSSTHGASALTSSGITYSLPM